MREGPLGQVKAIIFDLDGTLYRFPRSKKIAMSVRLCGSLGYLRHLSAVRSLLRKELFEDGTHFKKSFYYQLSQRSGHSMAEAEDWYNQKFWPAFMAMLRNRSQSRPGLAELLKKLHQAGIKLVVLSDYDHVKPRLEMLGLDPDCFDQLLSCEEFGQLKPAATPFLAALDSVKVPPAQGLVIGDSPQLDQKGAMAAHIPFMGISDKRVRPTDFYSWEELRSRLTSLLPQDNSENG